MTKIHSLLIALALTLSGCAGIQKALPSVLSEAALVVADASNALSVAEAILPILHLSEPADSDARSLIAKARTELSAAALAENATKELSEEQLDASLADFRKTWALIESTLKPPMAAKPSMAREVVVALPMPLAVRRVQGK